MQNVLNALTSNPQNKLVPLESDAIGTLLVTNGGVASALNLSANTLIKSGPGRLGSVSVVVPGSAAGALHDAASIGGVSAATEICTVPNAVNILKLDWPFVNGLVLIAGTAEVVAVAYS